MFVETLCACYKQRRKGQKAGVLKCHTLLSTITTLTTCDVSAHIIVAHWACAEQAPSSPRAFSVHAGCTGGWALTCPHGWEWNFNRLFLYFVVSCRDASACSPRECKIPLEQVTATVTPLRPVSSLRSSQSRFPTSVNLNSQNALLQVIWCSS